MIFFTVVIINTTVFIIILLIVNIYKIIPKHNPKNINNLKLPPENLYIQNMMLIPVNIQNIISSIYVIRFIVLKLFLSILKHHQISSVPCRQFLLYSRQCSHLAHIQVLFLLCRLPFVVLGF